MDDGTDVPRPGLLAFVLLAILIMIGVRVTLRRDGL